MASRFLSLLILVTVMALGAMYTLDNDDNEAGANRSIQIKGVFLLMDEVRMLERLKNLSAENANRENFLAAVRLMLAGESYVASSSVRYSWPDEVIIEIKEVTPVAIVDKYKLLLTNCQTIDVTSRSVHASIIRFDTAGYGSLDGRQCRRIINLLPKLASMPVRYIKMLANGDYVLGIGDSQLVVGEHEILTSADKIKRMAGLIRMNKISAGYIDMRYMSGAAIGQVSKS